MVDSRADSASHGREVTYHLPLERGPLFLGMPPVFEDVLVLRHDSGCGRRERNRQGIPRTRLHRGEIERESMWR